MFTVIQHIKANKEILSLPVGLQGKMLELISRLEQGHKLRMPDSKALGSRLFELRVSERNNIARTIYSYSDNTIILLHAFVKKTEKINKVHLDTSKSRLKEVLNND